VPRISAFDGMIILMFYSDHLPPHFHVRYGEHMALVHISPAQIGEGSLPRRIERQVLAWAKQREVELQANWDRAQANLPLEWIEP
jgi:Domain of unknown function (DUF4160)